MSEVKDFRPRLNAKEIQFLLETVKHTLTVLDYKEKAYKELEAKVYRLRRELRVNTSVFREFKAAREKLEGLRGFELRLMEYRAMCNHMIHRLKSILNGGKAHRHGGYDYHLRKVMP